MPTPNTASACSPTHRKGLDWGQVTSEDHQLPTLPLHSESHLQVPTDMTLRIRTSERRQKSCVETSTTWQ